jgi:riboflavin kinase/FMN adenylyltransferase
MKVHFDFNEIASIQNPILTIGTFDGVHVGHQKIINKLNEVAKQKNGESVLFTFFPHPRLVLDNEGSGDLKMIQNQAEKIQKLERMGLDHVIVYPFTREFSNTNAEDFIKEFLLDKLHVNTIVVGYDHQFGKNREGSLEHLLKLSKTFPFEVIEIPAHEIDEVNISSTKIRNALLNGEIETANLYLNEPFELSGIVIHGKKLGRTIGYPTANIEIEDKNKLIPTHGVYAVEVLLEDKSKHFGMLNIGIRPTVSNEYKLSCEVFIFDFDADLYGSKIAVFLLKRIRKEFKFSGIEALKEQIGKDEEAIRGYFNLPKS